jgi:hypothetical protein
MTCLTLKAYGLVALSVLLSSGLGCSSNSDDKTAQNSTAGSSNGGSNKMLTCATSHCINDIASSVFESESDCDNIWKGPCATEYKAYQKCLIDSEKCDADGQANLDSISGCGAATETLTKCSADHSK